jgi:D-aminopeptidase
MRCRLRDLGFRPGVLEPGPLNAITDVAGVRVGHTTLFDGDRVCTGVTAILPHEDDIFQHKVPAAVYAGNGFGKLAGYTQIEELGEIETPIVLTNTLAVPTAAQALIEYTLRQPGNAAVKSVNPVVGETNDGGLNDIRGFPVTKQHVFAAIEAARGGPVEEGCVGAGTGTCSFGFKAGIGTASRRLGGEWGGWTVGALVQSNYTGSLLVDGIALGKHLDSSVLGEPPSATDIGGSCMMVVFTDAPVCARNLKRIARRGMLGLARTGGIASHSSGDYVIAASTCTQNRIRHRSSARTMTIEVLRNEQITALFLATIEAVEEALLNALVAASTTQTASATAPSIPIDVLQSLRALAPSKR